MEELIDVLDENGNKTERVETRKNVHLYALRHKVILVAIIDSDGHLLMQQRSLKKKTNPGKWDISVAGHVSAGQTSIESAIREVEEELGLYLNKEDLNYIFSFKNISNVQENYTANHIYDFYLVKKENINLNDIKMQESEVSNVKICNLNEVKKMVLNEEVVNRGEVYERIFTYLK